MGEAGSCVGENRLWNDLVWVESCFYLLPTLALTRGHWPGFPYLQVRIRLPPSSGLLNGQVGGWIHATKGWDDYTSL